MAGLCHIANDILVFFCGGNNGQNRLVSFDGMAAADSRADNQLSEGDAGQRADGADLLCAVSGLPQWAGGAARLECEAEKEAPGAVLAVIYSGFSADVFVTEDDHVLSADRSGSTGNHICGRTRYIKDVLEDSFSTTGNGRNKRESGIAGG